METLIEFVVGALLGAIALIAYRVIRMMHNRLRERRRRRAHDQAVADFRAGVGTRYRIGGSTICWCGDIKDYIYGFMDLMPKKGDWVLSSMLSGKIGAYRIVNVEPCRDPQDMFFATVEFICYSDDN